MYVLFVFDSMIVMFFVKDLFYVDVVVMNVRVVVMKLEKMLFEKCKSEELYKCKVLNKIELILEKIICDRV